jgi:hypothetical protein
MDLAGSTPNAATASYAVPKRFGMAGILAIITLMAVLFGVLRFLNAPVVLYPFLAVLAMVTCLVQMRYGDVPRLASIIAGAVFLPVCTLATVALLERSSGALAGAICALPLLALAGAGCGYLTGACTAGIFLLMDLAEPFLPGGGKQVGPRYARKTPPPKARPAYGSPFADDSNPFVTVGPPEAEAIDAQVMENEAPNDPPVDVSHEGHDEALDEKPNS